MSRAARVLIVEDRRVVRETLKSVLSGFHIEFSEAPDGATALKLLKRREFDVTFLDIKLPDISGVDTLARSRERGSIPGKVIVLTGFPDPGTEAEASDLGVFRYLTKPIDRAQVRSAFADATGESATSLALHKPKQGAARGRREEPGRPKAAGRRSPLVRILVLDDKQSWLDTIERVLKDRFDLISTTSPAEACRRVRKEKFSLVVLDMKLVGALSGLDVLSRMRRAIPSQRAIILTAHPEFKNALESGRRGALDYVSKGSLATLGDTIQSVLNEEEKPIKVFLSYARVDKTKVLRLFNKLTERGFLPWIDVKNIGAGKKWEPEIRNAIATSDYFISCLSRQSWDKEGVLRKEVKQALDRQDGLLDSSVFFIPVRLEDCEVNEPFDRFQYVDLFRADGFARLLQALSSKRKTAK